jgi:hypothetical protein
MLRKPHGMGDLYAAQTVCVGSHSFPGDGAPSCEAAVKMIDPRNTRKTRNKKNLCHLRNLWFPFFHLLNFSTSQLLLCVLFSIFPIFVGTDGFIQHVFT